jgi:hypothetical protein
MSTGLYMTKSFANAALNAAGTGCFYKDILDYPHLYMSSHRTEIDGELDIFDWYAIEHGALDKEICSQWKDQLGGGLWYI